MDKLDLSLDDLIKARPSGGGKAPGKPSKGGPAGTRGSPYGRAADRSEGGGRGSLRPAAAVGGCRVFVGNLSWQTSWQTLKVRAPRG